MAVSEELGVCVKNLGLYFRKLQSVNRIEVVGTVRKKNHVAFLWKRVEKRKERETPALDGSQVQDSHEH